MENENDQLRFCFSCWTLKVNFVGKIRPEVVCLNHVFRKYSILKQMIEKWALYLVLLGLFTYEPRSGVFFKKFDNSTVKALNLFSIETKNVFLASPSAKICAKTLMCFYWTPILHFWYRRTNFHGIKWKVQILNQDRLPLLIHILYSDVYTLLRIYRCNERVAHFFFKLICFVT